MGIANYIKEIGRGKAGARPLTREQATDLMGQVLDQSITDLEIGAFCLAMRIKGETPAEMAGFLDAAEQRIQRLDWAGQRAAIVIPSYNGARKLPVLTPLLALLLAREGLPVLIHGSPTEDARITSLAVLNAMGSPLSPSLQAGHITYVTAAQLHSGLFDLLQVRRVVGLRNPAHSLVKMLNPVDGPSLLLCSYTHPEYAHSMAASLCLRQSRALLLRGTEGEVVADARRTPHMQSFVSGSEQMVQPAQLGSLSELPQLPACHSASQTASYIQSVMLGHCPVPSPIAAQVRCILQLA